MVKRNKLEFMSIQGGSGACDCCLEVGVDQLLETIGALEELPTLLRSAILEGKNWQKRNENTVEKVLLSPGLASQWVAALLAFGACVLFENGVEASLSDFLQRRVNEGRLSSLSIPGDRPGRVTGNAAVRFTPIDEPIVAAYAVLDMSGDQIEKAQIALTGAAREQAKRLSSIGMMAGKRLDNGLIDQVVAEVLLEVTPQGDYRGSAEYRREMAGLMTRRALEMCMKGAK